jgi:ferric-dicitrate binding protein FerR (iron transport regulator)
MNDRDDRHTLFAEYSSGDMTAERFHMLEMSLREDASLRSRFIEYMNLDAALGDLAALPESEVAEFERLDHSHETNLQRAGEGVKQNGLLKAATDSRLRAVIALSGALAAGLLIVATVWITGSNRNNDRTITDSDQPVAQLVTRVDAVLKKNSAVWSHDNLPVGEFKLERGLVHLRFDGGVTVFIEAPTTFDVVSAKRVVLHNGRLSANVPPEGIGFTVETPEAEVIDFGTEFSVDVATGTSEVHVFEGLVRVRPRSRNGGEPEDAVDLRTSQAIKIAHVTDTPVEIELATDRFIRTFDETRRRYSRTVKELSSVAFYRMAIRDQGLACLPPQYSGVVLTGEGIRPPHARGVFAGGSLRVLADSVGRGGRVDTSPPLQTGQFTLTAFVYLESTARSGTVATNIRNDVGNFALALDEKGFLRATVRNSNGDLQSVTSEAPVELHTWRHVVMTADGGQLRLYEDGHQVASAPCSPVADSEADVLWFGTDPDGLSLWDGRIDEVALFDQAISDAEVTDLYQAALEEIGKSE